SLDALREKGHGSEEYCRGLTMDTRVQIFVSSTFTDLVEERRQIARAILNLGHFPAGMEFFPATNDEQMKYIRSIIDNCDYYVIVLGGRYGSIGQGGISFTEMEYDYAVSKGIPICAFIHEDIEKLVYSKVEKNPTNQKKLIAFKEKVRANKLVRFWRDADELEANVVISLTHAFADHPGVGWRRANSAESPQTTAKLNRLNEDRNHFSSLYRHTKEKLDRYEELNDANAHLQYNIGSNSYKSQFSASELIRHFAALLNDGFDRQDVRRRLPSLFQQSIDVGEFDVDESAVADVLLFFEVFEIIEQSEDGLLQIRRDRKNLLKAAFKPSQTISVGGMDDEIPF
ncbi:MAG: DUF4062 domain-containing protein, partial [Paracoccaceae bacterium]